MFDSVVSRFKGSQRMYTEIKKAESLPNPAF